MNAFDVFAFKVGEAVMHKSQKWMGFFGLLPIRFIVINRLVSEMHGKLYEVVGGTEKGGIGGVETFSEKELELYPDEDARKALMMLQDRIRNEQK